MYFCIMGRIVKKLSKEKTRLIKINLVFFLMPLTKGTLSKDGDNIVGEDKKAELENELLS